MDDIKLGIIGGSGLYNMAELTDIEERTVDTPFGAPSAPLTIGTLHDRRVAFIPRHGKGHVYSPTTVPYKANAYALKSIGVKYVVAVSACGSLREEYAPGHIVVPDQLYDNTKLRSSSFFGTGLVAHVGVADPFSPLLSKAVADAVRAVDGTVHEGGTFITIEGPRFSTRGESNIFRQWGCGIIGMTTSPEAYLIREAEMAYACMAHVTDYDVWHESEEAVTIEMIIRTVIANTRTAQAAVSQLVKTMDDWAVEMPAHSALKDAVLTSAVADEAKERLGILVSRYY